MRQLILALPLILLTTIGLAQSTFTLSGTIKDTKGDKVIGAVILIEELQSKSAISDVDGNFKTKLPSAEYNVTISFIGYKSQKHLISLKSDTTLNIALEDEAYRMDDVDIYSSRSHSRVRQSQIGAEVILLSQMSKAPALFGESDIIKNVTYLPGVKAQGDGQSGFQVRGGSASQNLILLDESPVYNAGHVLGIFSVFNDDALASATLYKGLVPAQYGGGGSSIFDIETKRANTLYRYAGSLDVGLLTAKAHIEGPILSDKLGFSLSARRSYFDLFLKATEDYKDNILNFYDLNASLNYKINSNNMLWLTFFRGQDKMGLDDMFDMGWGNRNSTLNWYHRYNYHLTSNTSLIYSNYLSDYGIDFSGIETTLSGFINTYSLKQAFILDLQKHKITFGAQGSYLDIKSAEWLISSITSKEQRQGAELATWINDEWQVNPRLSISAGLRLGVFAALGGAPYYTLDADRKIVDTFTPSSGEVVESYLNIEPRLSVNYLLSPTSSLKFGYAKSSQSIYNIQNSSMSMPFTRYTMASNNLKPLISHQVSLGYTAMSEDTKYEFSAEGYYKLIDNVYDYMDGKVFSSDIAIETILLGGQGRSYGLELLAKKNIGKFTGWVGYTLSWTQTQIDGINNNLWYTANNDMRHDVSVVAMYELGSAWRASATWIYNTGQALSAPSAKYEINGTPYYHYAERNGYRAPSYHRLDVSFTHTKQKKGYTREWTFGAYNLYNRYNPYIISYEEDPASHTGTKTTQYSLFGILPSVTYGLKF